MNSPHSVVPSTGIFESFNARNLSALQVAQTFIAPKHYDDLVLRRHSLIVGPRGSGKTTLLKMLQLRALASWSHPDADSYRRSLDFVGVFVAADVSWGAQIEALGQNKADPNLKSVIGLSAFTTHVLLAFVDAIGDCGSHEVANCAALKRFFAELDKGQEATLVTQLADNWKLRPLIPSLHGLKLALRNRLSEIAQLSHRSTFVDRGQFADEIGKHEFLHIGFLEAIIFGIEAFNGLVKSSSRKWALLFDELEIAPQEIRQKLFSALRSTDQRLIFKLSLSPYHADAHLLETSIAAMSGEDYQPIELWYPKKEEGYHFSEALLRSMLRDLGCDVVDPTSIFGTSEFDSDEFDGRSLGSLYRPGTKVHKRFSALAKRDRSFARYLQNNNINISRMHELSEIDRAGLVRKVTSIVAVRETYRSEDEEPERSRKTLSLYTGAKSLFAVVEGNPRWFIGLIGPMVRVYSETHHRLPRHQQAKAIRTTSNRFRALLRTIPYRESTSSGRKGLGRRGLLSLLDAVGESFHNNVVVKDFSAEPATSFTVDANSSPELLEALGRALNAGAIILVPDETSDALLSSLRGKRFRLSYMLAPYYKIPLTLGRTSALSQVLAIDSQEPGLLRYTNGNRGNDA